MVYLELIRAGRIRVAIAVFAEADFWSKSAD
jgi:hypothetical protein